MSGKFIELFLSEFVVFLIPFTAIGPVSIHMTSLALVIYKTEEIGKTCNLEGFANLIGAIHEYNLRLIAYFLHSKENSPDTATGKEHQVGSVIHDPIDVLSPIFA